MSADRQAETAPASQAPPPQARPPGAIRSPPPETPRPAKKTARFITAEAAQSTLNLAPDGKLPELRLEEAARPKPRQEGVTVNPLVLLGLVSLSVVSSVLLVLYEPHEQSSSRSSQKEQARLAIQRDYFANLDSPGPQEPYQRLLREAGRAYARGDLETERRLYRRVLELLRAERSGFEGITGSPTRDKKLEEQITILLSDD